MTDSNSYSTTVSPFAWRRLASHVTGGILWTLALGIITGLAWLAYGDSLSFDVIAGRDEFFLTDNPAAHPLSWDAMRQVFSPTTWPYAPLARLSFALESRLWGLDTPAWLHVTNLLLHGMAAVLLGAVWYSIFHHPILAVAATALFLTLPVTAEAVSSVAGRMELLGLVFTLLALGGFVRFLELEGRQRGLVYAFTLLSSVAAGCCTLAAAMLPGLLILYHATYGVRARGSLWSHLRKMLLSFHYHVPLVLAGFLMVLLHTAAAGSQATVAAIDRVTLLQRLVELPGVLMRAGLALAVPLPRVPADMLIIEPGISWWKIIGIGVITLLPLVAAPLFRWNRQVFFAAGLLVTTLAPVLYGFLLLGRTADRPLYLPAAAWVFLPAYVIAEIWNVVWNKPRLMSLVALAGLGLMAANARVTRAHSRIWRDTTSYWSTVLEHGAAPTQARYHLAGQAHQAGNRHAARQQLELALQTDNIRDPILPAVAVELAKLLIEENNWEAALAMTAKYLPEKSATDTGIAVAPDQQASLYYQRARALSAMQHWEPTAQALEQSATHAGRIAATTQRNAMLKLVWFELGTTRAQLAQATAAEAAWSACLLIDAADRYRPANVQILEKLNNLLVQTGAWEEAVALLADYTRKHPAAECFELLGQAQWAAGDRRAAKRSLLKAVQIEPRRHARRLRVAAWLREHGETAAAIELVTAGLLDAAFVVDGQLFLYDCYYRQAAAVYERTSDATELARGMAPLLEKAMALQCSDFRAEILYSRYLATLERFAEAEQSLAGLLPFSSQRPEWSMAIAEFYHSHAMFLWLQGEAATAIQQLKKGLAVLPPGTEPPAMLELLDMLETQPDAGDYPHVLLKIELLLQKSISQDAGGAAALADCLQLLAMAVKKFGPHPQADYLKGFIHCELHDYKQALTAAQASIQNIRNPAAVPEPWYLAGTAAYHVGLLAVAADYLSQYLNFTQGRGVHGNDSINLLAQIAEELQTHGQIAQAMAALEAAVAWGTPDGGAITQELHARWRVKLAQWAVSLAHWQDAAAHLRVALTLLDTTQALWQEADALQRDIQHHLNQPSHD